MTSDGIFVYFSVLKSVSFLICRLLRFYWQLALVPSKLCRDDRIFSCKEIDWYSKILKLKCQLNVVLILMEIRVHIFTFFDPFVSIWFRFLFSFGAESEFPWSFKVWNVSFKTFQSQCTDEWVLHYGVVLFYNMYFDEFEKKKCLTTWTNYV